MDPRIRERREEVRRAEGRRRLRALGVLLAVTVVVVGGLLVVHSPLLGVRRVTVAGERRMGVSSLLRAAGVHRGEPLVDVDPARAEQRLDALPWVGNARVVRHWPSSLRVVVTVRSPVGQIPRTASPGGSVALVDLTGRVVGDAPAPLSGLPVLIGAGRAVPPGRWLAGTSGGGGRRSPGAPEAALALAGALDAGHLAATEVRLGSDGTASAVIDHGRTVVLFGSSTDLAGKLAVLRAMAGDGALRAAARVDLSVPDRPTVSPEGAKSRSRPGNGTATKG